MPKKGENIYKRKDGRWEGRFRKGRNEQGKIVYGYVYAWKYREVKQKLNQLKANYDLRTDTTSLYQGTIEEWMTYWLEHIILKQIKTSTYASYQKKMSQHIFPVLGDTEINKITKKDISQLTSILSDKGLSNTTIYTILTILKSALTKAYTERLILENPCIDIDFPKIKKKEITILTLEQQQQLEKVALKEIECSPVIIALYTGLRIGEISGLMWDDIDFKNRTLSVARTIQRISIPGNHLKTQIVFGTPKSKSSIRKIPIAKNLLLYLSEKKQRTTSAFVIANKNKVAEPRLITHWFKKNIVEAEVENIHFHVLRHTFATRCIEQGIDVATLSKLLGHNSTKMTLDTYAGSLWETREKAISIIDEQLKLKR